MAHRNASHAVKSLSLLLLLPAVLLVAACDSASRLATEIAGTWSGAPVTIELPMTSATTASSIDTYTFTHDPDGRGGNLTVTSMLSLSAPAGPVNATTGPVSISAAATASIQGRWEAIDDDDISVTLQPKTLQVSVDPSAVVVSTSPLSAGPSASVDSITPALVATITETLRRDLPNRYLAIKQLHDVEIKGSLLNWEINDREETLSRQGSVE